MAFGLGGILKAVFTTAATVYKAISGDPKPAIEVILPKAASSLFESIMEAGKYQDLSTQEKIDSWLTTMDATFGSEAGALDVINTMPADAEEKLTDHLLEAARVVLYNKAKVAGYYQTSD